MYIRMIASTFAFFAASILLLRDSVLLSAKKTYKTRYMAVGILCLIAGLYRLFALVRWICITSNLPWDTFYSVTLPSLWGLVLLIAPVVILALSCGALYMASRRLSYLESGTKERRGNKATSILCLILCVLLVFFEVVPTIQYLYP